MKYYKKNYLKTWTKEELIDHILCLQHNLKCEEEGNDHLYKTVTAVMHKDPTFAKAVSEVPDVWNSSFGHRYIKEKDNKDIFYTDNDGETYSATIESEDGDYVVIALSDGRKLRVSKEELK